MKIITTVNGQEIAVDSVEITKDMPNAACYKRFQACHDANIGTGKLMEAEVMGYEIKLGLSSGVELAATAGYTPSYSHVIYMEDEKDYPELKKIKQWVEKNLGETWFFSVRWIERGDRSHQIDADCEKIRARTVPIAASIARSFLATADSEEIKTDLFELHFERFDCIAFEIEEQLKKELVRCMV